MTGSSPAGSPPRTPTASSSTVAETEHQVRYDELGAGKVQLEFARVAALSDDDLEEIPVADDHDDDFEEDEA